MIPPGARECQTDVSTAAKIFSEHGDFIYQFICSKVNNKTQADDIFQDFFLSLAQRPIPQHVENIKGYLCTSITNDIVDVARKGKNYDNNMNKYCGNHNHSIHKRIPEKALIEAEETKKLFKFIKERLTSTQYQAMVLRYRDNLSFKEIAEEMTVKEESVRKYIYRGLSKIRQFLKQKEGNDDNRSK